MPKFTLCLEIYQFEKSFMLIWMRFMRLSSKWITPN